MMKSLIVPLVNFEEHDLDTALELEGARFDVNCNNWPEGWPYAPICNGRIARTEDALVVDFRVSGLDLRAQEGPGCRAAYSVSSGEHTPRWRTRRATAPRSSPSSSRARAALS